MYPFKFDNTLVKNRWYMAAFSKEITRTPMERTILNKPVVMYRKEDGTPVAMYGLCPHRYFPLAQGHLDGDLIVCGYHGFKFHDKGKCVEIPSQEKIGKNFCQPSYKLVEKGPICWIWMGDEDKCDESNIPPYDDFGLEQEGWVYHSPLYLHLEGRYQLLVDNLMDLTHLPYVHHHIPSKDSMKKTQMETFEREKSYRVLRKSSASWDGFFEAIFGAEAKYEGIGEFQTICDFYGPELVKTCLPIFTAINGDTAVPGGLGSLFILHGITPETDNTTHYFGFSTRNFRLEDKAVDEFQYQADIKIRQQDVEAINAVEKRLELAVENQRELLVIADKAAVQVRRKIEAMLSEEQA